MPLMCFFNVEWVQNDLPQILQTKFLSFKWTNLLWLSMCPLRENALPQVEHLWSFIFSCIAFTCILMIAEVLNALLQNEQLCFFSFKWTALTWMVMSLFWENSFWHTVHANSRVLSCTRFTCEFRFVWYPNVLLQIKQVKFFLLNAQL